MQRMLAVALALGALTACDDTVFTPVHGGGDGGGYPADWDGVATFLEDRCSGCHGGSGGYTFPEDLEDDVSSGDQALVVPGDPDASLIWQVLVSDGDPTPMPMGRETLPFQEIQHVRLWIHDGAELP